MAMLPVLEHPDTRLRKTARPVTAFDADLASLVDDMLETVDAHQALGLSSIQVDDERAVLVITPTADPSAPRVFINPELVRKSAPGFVEEGCLSIPGIEGNVIRSTQVTVRAMDVSGERFECDLHGMDAVTLQHEMDHLVGTLFIDRLSIFKRFRIRSELRRRVRAAAGSVA